MPPMFIFSWKNCCDLFVHGGRQGWIVYAHNRERIFLKKGSTRFGINNETTFIVNEEDEYSCCI